MSKVSGFTKRSGNGRGQRPRKYALTGKLAERRKAAGPGDALENVSPDVVKNLVKIFKLLSDETRLRVLLYLTQQHELHVRALCERLQQSQPAVSHHLALLRLSGLIELRREGKHNYYHLMPRRFEQLLDLVFAAVPKNDRQIRFEDYVLSYAPGAGRT